MRMIMTAKRLVPTSARQTATARAIRTALPAFALAGTFAAPLAQATPVAYQVFNSPRKVSSVVFEDPHYNHAATVAQLGDRVYVAWNGNPYNSSESQAGQVIMLSTSDDGGAHWTPPVLPFVKEYRAFDDVQNKAVDATPGNADDNHKVRFHGPRQWQPSMTVFHGKLLMFWGVDRSFEGSALLMSTPDGNSGQWRTNELHFKSDGTPYFLPEIDSKAPATDDPTNLSLQSGASYTKVPGAAAMPQAIHLNDMPPKLLQTESPKGESSVPAGTVQLAGQRLVPAPNETTVLKMKDGTEVLAVAVILHQTQVDWDVAVKIPGLLTTTDLEHWQLSLVPMGSGSGDLLASQRGDVGLVSAWEPSVEVDRDGKLVMAVRLNTPPLTASGGNPVGTGYRMATMTGTWMPGAGVRWDPPHLADYDVPATRSMLAKIPQQDRWVMVANHDVQGVTYAGDKPMFNAEKYEPWARENIEMFFSTRGTDDFVAGLNLTGNVGEIGAEVVHYPYVQSASIGGHGDDMLVAYSTHRREKSCVKGHGSESACHDSIRFMRIEDLPKAGQPAIYPNHFASYFTYGKAKPQGGTYDFANNMLTLRDRGSAGIETGGEKGCMSLRFKIDGDLAPNEMRPVLSFGRTSDRANPIGLVVRGAPGGALRVQLGDHDVGQPLGRGAWSTTRVCYDFGKNRLSAGGYDWQLGGKLSKETYLGDNTLAKRDRPLPDITFDVPNTSLDVDAEN